MIHSGIICYKCYTTKCMCMDYMEWNVTIQSAVKLIVLLSAGIIIGVLLAIIILIAVIVVIIVVSVKVNSKNNKV